jgi:hypothetical protein
VNADEERWRAALEARGAADVMTLLHRLDPLHPEQIVNSVGDRPPHPTRGFIANWVREREAAAERRETYRFCWILFWTIVAAIAASIAAWPEIKTLLRPWLN